MPLSVTIALLCFLYAGSLTWNTVQFANNSRAALKWPCVEGVVRDHSGRRHVYKDYEYYVGGSPYKGDLFDLPNPMPLPFQGTQKLKYRDNARLLVYFDPAHPERSSVNRTLDDRKFNANIFWSFVAVIIGMASFANYYSSMVDKSALGLR